MRRKNSILMALCVLIVSVSIMINRGKEISGTDDKAIEAIGEVTESYEPWLNNIWEPSGEIENLLFALQAAIGIGTIGFYVRNKIKCLDKSRLSQN